MVKFSVSNALGVFMEYMNGIFHPYLDQFMVVFIDEILVYSKSNEDHVRHLRNVLQVLKEKKLYAKLSKCEFWLREVIFISHVISSGGIVIDPAKVDAMFKWYAPKLVMDIKSFLELVGYYIRFIEVFKDSLTFDSIDSKWQAFVWDLMCEDNFRELKNKLTTTLVLILPYPKEPFVIYCDASKMGLGGVLMQNGQVVTYASQQLKVHERNYLTHDLELEVVVFMLKL